MRSKTPTASEKNIATKFKAKEPKKVKIVSTVISFRLKTKTIRTKLPLKELAYAFDTEQRSI